jgi:heat shock protein beta
MKTQDVSKKGLKYGDEDEDAAERKELNAQNIAFGPLLNWLKRELAGQVNDGESLYHKCGTDNSRIDQSTRHLTLYDHRRLDGLVSKYATNHGCSGRS